MQVSAGGTRWVFGGTDIDSEGRFQSLTIPRIDRRAQMILNRSMPPKEFIHAVPVPAPTGSKDQLLSVLSDSRLITHRDEGLVRDAVAAAHRIENPKIHNPETIDCASCHIAQAVRVWATRKFPDWGLHDDPFRFHSPLSLRNASPHPEFTNIVRAFGYFGRAPAISQRVIHETAAVVEALNFDCAESMKKVVGSDSQ